MHDRLGSVRLVFESVWDTASSQYKPVVRNLYTYDAYGKRLGEGADTIETVYNPLQFTGQWYDAEIGQYDLRARQYDPQLLRFTSRDPVFGGYEDPLTLHRYLYCANDPINRNDINGKFFGYFDFLSAQAISTQARKINAKLSIAAGTVMANAINGINTMMTWINNATVFASQKGLDAFTQAYGYGRDVLSTISQGGMSALAQFGDAVRVNTSAWIQLTVASAMTPDGSRDAIETLAGSPSPPTTAAGWSAFGLNYFLEKTGNGERIQKLHDKWFGKASSYFCSGSGMTGPGADPSSINVDPSLLIIPTPPQYIWQEQPSMRAWDPKRDGRRPF